MVGDSLNLIGEILGSGGILSKYERMCCSASTTSRYSDSLGLEGSSPHRLIISSILFLIKLVLLLSYPFLNGEAPIEDP